MNLIQKLDSMIVMAQYGLTDFLDDERGDTNFISILVILAIVTVLIGSFIAFKDSIIGWVTDTMDKFWET